MKKILLLLIPFLIFTLNSCFNSKSDKKNSDPSNPVNRKGTALIITGAAARIPQEAALLEELHKRGLLKDLVFISGVSSGSLNAVMLNGILSGRMSWDEYRNILFSISNDEVFIQEKKKIPVDTSPLRELLTRIVEEKLGYHTIGDLPFTTEISITNVKELDLKKTVYRMCSRKINEETDTTLNLVDIMMASTAFPVAFPPARIRNVTTIPDLDYIDGAAGEDYIPYHALPGFERFRGSGVEKIYIISRKIDSIPEISEELKNLGINDRGVFDRLGISLDEIFLKEMRKRLETYISESPELAALTYIWMPEFKASFPLFNFSDLKKQYDLTSEWAKIHDPIPLNEFMSQLEKNK